MNSVLEGFEDLAWEYRDSAVAGRQHGFTNANDTLKELHSGISKAYPCGAGLGLLGVGTAGDINLCHRFVDSPVGKMGHVNKGGVDHAAREQFPRYASLGRSLRLPYLLGAPGMRGRVLSRSLCSLRRHFRRQLALLRLDPWMERFVSCGFTGRSVVQNPSFLNRFNEN